MRNIEVYLTEKQWVEKPTADETKAFIAKPILKNKVILTLEEFAKEVSENSKVCMLGLFEDGTTSGSGKQIIRQEVLMLDIDNTNKKQEHFTYEEALKHPFVKENVSFMYKTLSSTVKHERFRMVLPLETPLKTKEEVTEIYTALFNLLRTDFKGQLDEGIKNANRLFYGGTKGYDVINWKNSFKPEGLLLDESFFSPIDSENEKMDNKKSLIPDRIGSKDIMLEKHVDNEVGNNMQRNVSVKHSIPKVVNNVYELLRQKRFSEVEAKLVQKNLNCKVKEFNSLDEFRKELIKDNSLSMREFLDLPKEEPFLDIFHEEKEPSGSVFLTGAGVELYKCHSSTSEFTGDIISVIAKLTQEGQVKTLQRLTDWLKISINEPFEIAETKEAIEFIKSELLSNDLKSKHPYVYKMFWRYKETFCTFLDIYCSQGYSYNNITGHYEFLSFMSREYLNKEYAKYYGKKLAPSTLHTTINLMALAYFIKKLSFNEVPKDLLGNLVTQKKINGYERYTDVVVIPKFEASFMEDLNVFCKLLSDTNFTKTALSKDYVIATYGMDRANNTFAQTRPEDKKVSEKFQDMLKDTIGIIEREFENSNYIQESILLNRLIKNRKRTKKTNSKTDVEMKYKQIRSTLEDGYGYTRLKLTNDLRKELNISDKDIPRTKRPILFVNPNKII